MSTPPRDPRREYPGFETYDPAKRKSLPASPGPGFTMPRVQFSFRPLHLQILACVAILGVIVSFLWSALGDYWDSVILGDTNHTMAKAEQYDQASAQKVADDETKAVNLYGAIGRYKSDNNDYPNTLSDMVPRYIPDNAWLHNETDPNPNPSNITFVYKKPAPGAAPETPLFSYDSILSGEYQNKTMSFYQKTTFTIDGKTWLDMLMPMPGRNGSQQTLTMHSDGTNPPTMGVGGTPGQPAVTPTPN